MAEVEVNTETGETRVLKMTCAVDAVSIINPQAFEGQVEGGMDQGVGFGLREEYVLGKTNDYVFFKFPTIRDSFDMEIITRQTPRNNGPLGATGIGEMTMISTAPAVVNAICNACGGRRSSHWFAEEVTGLIDGNAEAGIVGARQAIAGFINALWEQEIIFTLNTTHAVNMVALGFNFKPGYAVLLTGREHNSNLVPWLRLQKSGLIKVVHIEADLGDYFDFEAYERCFKTNRVRLVSIAYTSNVTGVTLPAREIISIAHQYGARVLLDGAQTVPHQTVDVRTLDVDFLAFLNV